MIDHFSISVTNYQKSIIFYDQTLEILGYKRIYNIEVPGPDNNFKYAAGYGAGEKPDFWVSDDGIDSEYIGRAKGVHLAFSASSAEAVQAWYEKCLELGGKDNGKAGPRPEYHPGYYGAFIIDPDGWRIEACFHQYK
jgi:catechol 2,3-dioxygenase-like lactoylglutathione lyase family enzyme